MPMVPTLNDSVALSSGSNFRLATPIDTGEAGVANALSGMGAELSKEATINQVKLNQIAVAKATSAAQTALNQKQTDLLNKTGENALGTAATKDTPATPAVTQDFTQFAQTTHDSIAEGLGNDTQRRQFETWYSQVAPQMLKSVYAHEQQQFTLAHQAEQQSLADNTQSAVQSALINGNFEQASASMRAGLGIVNDMGLALGTPTESIQENQKKWVYGTLSNTVNQLIKDNRPGDADKAIQYYKPHLSGDEVDELESRVKPQMAKVQARGIVANIMSDPSTLNPDGTPNVALIHQKIRDFYEKGSSPGQTAATTDDINQLDSFMKALNQQEAPGDYSAVNPDSGATGAYQIMPENWPSWAKAAGLPEDAPQTPENQEKVARAKVTEYFSMYGNWADVAKAWYGGPGAVSWSSEAQQKAQGEYPSVQSYADSVLSRMAQSPTAANSGVSTAVDYAAEAQALTFADSMIRDADMAHKQQVQNTFDQLHGALNSGQITSYTELQDYVDSLGLTDTEKSSAMAIGMQSLGVARTVNQWSQADAEQNAMRDLVEGNITSQGQFEAQYAGQLNWDVYARMDKAFLSGAKWATPANMATLDGAVKANNLSQTEKGMLMDIINQRAQAAFQEGRSLTSYDINDIANEEAAKVKTSWYTRSPHKVDIPPGISQQADGTFVNDEGDAMNFDPSTNTWHVK